MEIQLIIVLLIAFLILGPERMMDLAVKLGEMVRKIRDMWEEVKMQAYMEEVNRKVMEGNESELLDKTEDETEDDDMEALPQDDEDYNEDYLNEDILAEDEEETKEDEHREQPTTDDASDGASEGTQNKAD